MNVAYRRHQQVVLGVAMVAFFASAPGQSFLISVFVDDMLVGTGLDRTTFSALYAAGTVVSAMTMLLLGRLIDRHGLRPAWVVITLALAAASGLASVATGAVVAFLALATLRTFGQGSFPQLGWRLAPVRRPQPGCGRDAGDPGRAAAGRHCADLPCDLDRTSLDAGPRVRPCR